MIDIEKIRREEKLRAKVSFYTECLQKFAFTLKNLQKKYERTKLTKIDDYIFDGDKLKKKIIKKIKSMPPEQQLSPQGMIDIINSIKI